MAAIMCSITDLLQCESGAGRDWLRAHVSSWPDVQPEVRDFLRRIPWRERCAVVLNCAYGLTQEQIAELLGISDRTVRADIARAAERAERMMS